MVAIERKHRTIFFMADVHLGQDRAEDEIRIEALVSFFNHVTAQGGCLFILGDFFDFWFEYRSVIPRAYFKALSALKDLAASGIEVAYIGGNHDYWIGPFLETEVGVRTYTEPVDLRAQGRRIFLAHGDGLARRDWPYRTLRRALHSRPVIALYRLLHPDLGIPFAGWVSRCSRSKNHGWLPDTDKLWNEVGRPRFESGFDAVILGHIHRPAALSREDKELFIIGNWINQFSFLVLEQGVLRQEYWRESSRSFSRPNKNRATR